MPDNAANRDSYNFPAPGTAYSTTPSLQFLLSGRGWLELKFTNDGKAQYNPPSASNPYTFKWQDSPDGIVWTDIAAATGSVVPGGVFTQRVETIEPHLRLLAFGNAAGRVEISSDIRIGLGSVVV